jgi:NTP pyrophosphatase (non-canonical NTP hydrolase)
MGFALALKPASREPIRSVVEPCFAPISDIDEFGRFTESIWFGGKDGELDIRQISIMALGLTGETGEVAELLKKLLRDGKLDLEHLRKELGDVAYYWARICLAFGFKPSEVLGVNRAKLLDRLERGVLSGSGDNR